MTAPRKYNPGFLDDDELVASFCVRTSEFESIVETLRECTASANTHQIVIGPRGSGKTSLLLRVAAEMRRDAGLSSAFFPVVFAEESYEISTAGEFWLECLSRLADQAPRREGGPDLRRSFEELRAVRDDRTLGDRCLGAVLDFADREGKRLVLTVENMNMMFRDMADADAGWRLRSVLQTEPRIVLLASATSRFEEIDNVKHALYDLFQALTLRPLDTRECAALWEAASGRPAPPETVRSLEILTGGSPRLLAIVARFGAGRSFRDLMADLLDLIDDHTEYFKSHLETLPAQERRVYLALADLWKPALTREIADRARLDTSKCSAQLARLVDRGVVQMAGGSARRRQYYLSERLYNIYYLLRRSRGPDRLIEALIRFMASYYSPRELVDIGVGIAREARELDAEMRALHRSAFARLIELPALTGYRGELLATVPGGFMEVPDRGGPLPEAAEPAPAGLGPDRHRADEHAESAAARAWIDEARGLVDQNRPEEALPIYDEVVRRFGESEAPALLQWVALALEGKGIALSDLNRPEEALAVYDEVVRRYGESEAPALLQRVAIALVGRGIVLRDLNRPEEELAVYDEVVHRFGESDAPALLEWVATALVGKGSVLRTLDRSEEELAVYDEVVRRYGENDAPALLEWVAMALGGKGLALRTLDRLEEALAVYDEVVRRYGESEVPALLQRVAMALEDKGSAFRALDRLEEALAVYDEVVRRFANSKAPALLEWVATALVGKGSVLHTLDRPEEELAVCDEVVRRFGKSDAPALLEWVATTLVGKGSVLHTLDRSEEALAVYDEVVLRFGESDAPALLERVAAALVGKGLALRTLNRPEEALAVYGETVRRFGESEPSNRRSWAAVALLRKAGIELELRRYKAAVETAGRALDPRRMASREIRLRGHLLRAKAILASDGPAACEQDIEAALAILPELDSLPKDVLDDLVSCSVEVGAERMRELVGASSAAELLLPLTTALERELGMEPRVAREVEEVAEDIRRDLAKLREGRAGV